MWLMRRDLEEAGADLRSARLAAGLTLREVGEQVGVVPSMVLKVERGTTPGARPALIAAHAAAVGMRARIRVYPDGEPIRDAAQASMAAAFRQRLGAKSTLLLEQAVTEDPSDRRAFDAVLTMPGCRCAIEFVSRLHDSQAQLRELHLKLRDGAVDRMVIVVKDTRTNRRAVALVVDLVRATFPLGPRAVWAALSAGRAPSANGIVFL